MQYPILKACLKIKKDRVRARTFRVCVYKPHLYVLHTEDILSKCIYKLFVSKKEIIIQSDNEEKNHPSTSINKRNIVDMRFLEEHI